MKRSSCCFRLCLILIAIGFLSTVQAQQVFKTTSASVIGYLEYLPKDYHKNSNKYPVVIFLHGKGEKGLTSTNPNVLKKEIHQVEKIGPPRYVKKGEQFPFILISPQLKSSYGDWPASYVMEVVNHVKRYLRIDESRIYLTGLSLGGGGTWTTAQEYPHIFAAIAPVCGSRNSPSKACDLVRNDVPVWAFHGDKDKVVTHLRSVNMINAINSCSPKPSPQAKITIYPGVKHNAWDKAYQTDHSVHRPNVYEWLLSHKKSGSSGAKQNKGPVANAGADKVLTLPTNSVTLTASAKDEDGKIASYKWTKKSGGEATLKNAATPSLIVSNLAEGSYTFQVVASDNDGGQDADDVIVTVKEQSNKVPVANAGSDKVLTLPTNSITLTASAKDEDGKIASFKWTKKSGGEATLKNAATPSLIVSNLAEGSYKFQVVATDDDGGQDADDVIVTVKKQSNKVPVANAGSDKVLTLPTNSITLTASAKDEDGKIASYKWIKKSGAEAALKNTLTPALIVSNLSIGTYVFQVTAIDDDGGQGHDEVIVTVNANNNTNRPPVANAGSDKTLTLPANSLVLDAKGSDPDGDALAFSWNQQAGEPAIMKNASTPRVEISGLTHGQYVFRLTVKDNKGGVHTDDVQVTVQGGSSGSGAITAFAGPDQTIEVPVASITIFGSGKSTSEIVAYQWTQVTGKAVRLENTTGAQLRLVDITHEGTCAFKLWVKDSQGRTDVDHVRLYFKGNATAGSKTPSNVVHDPIEDIDTLGQASAELPGESMGQDNGLSKPVDLTSDNPDEFNDLTVNIFNGNGQRIYSGKWNPEQYRKVFREKGLYIYTVESQHRNVQSGKIYVRY
ncbi:MAG TPA: PKD domain-containing protein [Ohtaekwangia sp.]|nr:PKD domain-containing protein [Ohtaekwangia sp.]